MADEFRTIESCKNNMQAVSEKFSAIHWLMGIIITLNLSFFVYVGYLSVRVNAIDLAQGVISTKLDNSINKQNDVAIKIDKMSDKIDALTKKP